MGKPYEVVEQQVAAYNARDVEGFVACYAPDAAIINPDGSPLARGHDGIRATYGPLFAGSPNLVAEISNQIEVGDYVVDEEHVTGFVLPDMPTEVHAVAVYRVQDDLIREVHLYH